MGLSIGLDTAVKALRAHQLAVDVASHNIANAQTPGFSRQRVLLRPIGIDGSDHFTRDNLLGRAGYGVDAKDVNRIRDTFLDFQARQGMSTRGQYNAFSTPLSNAEVVFNDPSDDGMSALLGKFWAAWHDVVNEPESLPGRTALIHATTTFTQRVKAAYDQLTQQRLDLNQTVSGIGEQINAKATEIAGLNLQIKQVELNGDMANDLRDRRDLILDELSQLGNISYAEDESGSMSVYLGTHELVFGTSARTVKTVDDPANPGMVKLQFNIDNDDVKVSSGQLKGILDARDVALPELIGKLNNLATGIMNSVNSLHQTGYGLDGSTGLAFFTGTDASNMAINSAIAGSPQSIATASATGSPGDPSIALAIANLQQSTNMLSGSGANDLVVNEALSAGNVASGITLAGSLQPGTYHMVAVGPNVELRYGSATGPVVGTATLADINPPGGSITFMNGTNTVATISMTVSAPYTAATQQADLTAAGNNTMQVEASASTYYSNIVSVLGADVNRSKGLEDSSGLLVDHLDTLRQSVSGVNIDEEVTNLNSSQHAYNAAAKVITVIDEMLDTLINRTGVG
ncbi:MAG: flagellar hook-associated protein FlgK [Dehalococcoidia bacterium]